MAKQWALSAKGMELHYTDSGYKLSGYVRWEFNKWHGGAVVVPEVNDGRASALGTILGTEEIGEATAAVEKLMADLCEKLRGIPCGQ